jgi:ketosteroid isomerase-like protein
MRDVEIVRDQFAAVNERDFPRAMDHYAEDVELVVAAGAFLESGTFRGRDAVGDWFGNWFATFEPNYRFDIDDAREIGNVVLLTASHRGRGRTSGVEVAGKTGYVYRVQDGKITHVEIFASPAEALDSAERRG